MNRYVVTRMDIHGKPRMCAALCDSRNKLIDVRLSDCARKTLLGNVYVGRVLNIVKNMNAAFIQIAPDITCYYPLEDYKNPVFTHKCSQNKALVAGDELLVQVKKEAQKTKEPMVTTNISFTGKYVVLTTENKKFGLSAKLSPEQKMRLKELLSDYQGKEAGLIVRTNAKDAADEEILAEAAGLYTEYEKMLEMARHATHFTCLFEEEPEYLRRLKDLREDSLEEVVTDDRDIFEKICASYAIPKEALCSGGILPQEIDRVATKSGIVLHFYRDNQYPLASLYSLKSQLEQALSERVWLKSGANLIIQATEALTVIDVNTGKNIARKEPEEQFLSVNLEAAAEIARQLRLRNISGIIIVDFVNLKYKEARKKLLQEFSGMLALDPVQTTLIDMTPLGLVEITRKKIQKSLAESVRS